MALRPHELREGLNTLKKSVSPSLVRKNSTDTKLTDAEKDEILSNIEEIKNDAETTKSLIKEGEKSVAKNEKSVESETAPTEKEMENVRPVAQTEKAIAELTAEQDLIDDSLSSVNNAEINEKVSEKLTDEKEKDGLLTLTEETNAKAEALLSRAKNLGQNALEAMSNITNN